jgi:hypothetical protein
MRFLWLGLFGGLALLLAGCGNSSTVSGTVTYNGEPVEDGYIAFLLDGSGESSGGPISHGKYKVSVRPGKYHVQVNASKLMPLPPGTVGMGGKTEEVRSYIPAEYTGPQTKLTADVPGSDPHDFKLEGPR